MFDLIAKCFDFFNRNGSGKQIFPRGTLISIRHFVANVNGTLTNFEKANGIPCLNEIFRHGTLHCGIIQVRVEHAVILKSHKKSVQHSHRNISSLLFDIGFLLSQFVLKGFIGFPRLEKNTDLQQGTENTFGTCDNLPIDFGFGASGMLCDNLLQKSCQIFERHVSNGFDWQVFCIDIFAGTLLLKDLVHKFESIDQVVVKNSSRDLGQLSPQRPYFCAIQAFMRLVLKRFDARFLLHK